MIRRRLDTRETMMHYSLQDGSFDVALEHISHEGSTAP